MPSPALAGPRTHTPAEACGSSWCGVGRGSGNGAVDQSDTQTINAKERSGRVAVKGLEGFSGQDSQSFMRGGQLVDATFCMGSVVVFAVAFGVVWNS